MMNMKRILAVTLLSLSLQVAGADMPNSQKVKVFFQTMTYANLEQVVPVFYAEDVQFKDPVHELKGRIKVQDYYKNLYKNVDKIRFDFSEIIEDKNTVIGVWKMTLETKSLNGGAPVVVDGNSVIRFNEQGQAVYHRDYFDMGEFIYENVPVLGFVIRKIKDRMK